MPPYLPFLEALGEYMATAPIELLCDQVGPHAATLATLLPEVPRRLGPPPPPYPLGPEQARFRLYEAVAALLAAIAAPGPLTLLLDDLHWADASTCDLLVHVAGRVRAAPLLVVGAYREGEARGNPAFVRALAELNRRRQLVILPLEPLGAEESRGLAANLLRGEIAPGLADVLHRQAEGNPFFLEELLRALVEQGALVWSEGCWALGSRLGSLLPPWVAEAIRQRLTRLDPAVVALLLVAAVAGQTFESTLVAQVAQLDVEQADELLLAAARAQLLRPEANGAYAFSHDLVREALCAELGSARRQRFHRAIGEVLEAQGDAGDAAPRRLADLAYHFAEAGVRARGVTYALAAAEQALRASAPAEALAHYRTAVHLLGPGGDPSQRASALASLGHAANLAGDYAQAAEAYLAAQDAWLRVGNLAAAGAWHRLGRVRWRQEVVDAARKRSSAPWSCSGQRTDRRRPRRSCSSPICT